MNENRETLPQAFPSASPALPILGMSLREWYAGLAMQAILQGGTERHDGSAVAEAAFSVADRMMEKVARELSTEGSDRQA